MKLSKKMEECLGKCKEHGKLIRLPGGFWTGERVPMKKGNHLVPVWYFSYTIIEALIKRGLTYPSKTKQGKHGEFPIEVKPVINPGDVTKDSFSIEASLLG